MKSEQEMGSMSRKRKAEENDPADLTVEHAQKIVESFTQEQLLEIAQDAAIEHREVREQVRSIADNNKAVRKVFVRGLSWETNSETLKGIFSEFGELVESVVIVDKSTGKSKGYGFVTFADIDGALNALKEPSKKIDGFRTVSQFALAGFRPSQTHVDVNARKIYVGNVPLGMEADRLFTFFSQYGDIEEGPLGFDKQTGRSRGYALFIFKTVEAAKLALEEPIKTIDDGHQLSCKLANEKQNPKSGRVNFRTIASGSGIHPLNQRETQVGIIPRQGFDNPSSGANQVLKLSVQDLMAGWNVPNSNGSHANSNFTNQIFPPYQYAVPQVGGYGLCQLPEGNRCTYGAQPTLVASHSQSSRPAEPNSIGNHVFGGNLNYNCVNQISPPYQYAVPQAAGYGRGQTPQGNSYSFVAPPTSLASQSQSNGQAQRSRYPSSLYQFPEENQYPQHRNLRH